MLDDEPIEMDAAERGREPDMVAFAEFEPDTDKQADNGEVAAVNMVLISDLTAELVVPENVVAAIVVAVVSVGLREECALVGGDTVLFMIDSVPVTWC